ncbi:methylmalonyl-CoA epimerase [Halalkalicoccus jeotgali]|uniref:Lyase / dioxygenase 2 n=1 Tax=Halalkalicoccus jeotgali (strain DSM 18796 / CECT 7217 / JCM 14584 / KCTC 4019 / B3) TaxID=795797 RepID=D8J8Z7_HALJB|nr:methylmalonyl-CoA epimerase [Halalkalicoccus jeotgali]ADJ16266.1 lyase / dioxygenase 2 (lactoylglutathione lyase, aromatic compounds dioxygenase) [Halalkalicoccus jeotgali B3]ELY37000.1 lyase / dioxygenase 2 [Halalkalicoccus jeotgali B3]
MRFDHAGIATDDAEGLMDVFETAFDASLVHEETFEGMDVRFLDLGNGFFELLEPRDDGPIGTYLERNGPGIHHLALETDDAERALERAREADIDPIDEEPRQGAWGHDVAFLHPKSTGGVLIEFVEH